MKAARRGRCRRLVVRSGALLIALACAAITPTAPPASAAAASSGAHRPASTSLSAPKTTFAQDTKFFTEVAELDAGLATYEQKQGNLALRALLTDGSAFCALLKRGGGIDAALLAEAEGARSTETQTSLPLSVTTFNTIESVALLTLCPQEQKLVPTSVRAKIRRLGATLSKPTG